MDGVKTTAIEWVEENKQRITDLSYRIWEYAEMGLTEFKSSDDLVAELEQHGFEVERGQARMPTAFVGTYSHGTGKPVIGFLAEFDALPNGHTCGHNLFGAGSVGAAIATKEAMQKHNIDGTIKLFGTPSEDTHGGKVWMVREGVFDGCDAIVSWHPGTKNSSNHGSCLALQTLEVEFTGRSAHAGAAPEKGRSALDGLMIASMAMEFLREHAIDQMRIQYVVTSGGLAPNIVPDYAKMRLTVRGPKMADVEYLRSREGGVDDCIRAGALGSGTDVTMQVVSAFYNKVPNKVGSYLMNETMKAIPAPEFTAEEETLVEELAKKYNVPLDGFDTSIHEPTDIMGMGSDDSGDVSHVAPLISLSTTCSAVGSPGHHLVNLEQYGSSIGHKGTVYASKILASVALELLTDEQKLREVFDEFQENMKEADYRPILPEDLWPPIPDENPADFAGPAAPKSSPPKTPESLLFWKK